LYKTLFLLNANNNFYTNTNTTEAFKTGSNNVINTSAVYTDLTLSLFWR